MVGRMAMLLKKASVKDKIVETAPPTDRMPPFDPRPHAEQKHRMPAMLARELSIEGLMEHDTLNPENYIDLPDKLRLMIGACSFEGQKMASVVATNHGPPIPQSIMRSMVLHDLGELRGTPVEEVEIVQEISTLAHIGALAILFRASDEWGVKSM
jgi:hypothetical protein